MSSEPTVSVELNARQIDYITRAILMDIDAISEEASRIASNLSNPKALRTAGSDVHIEQLVAIGEEFSTTTQSIKALQEGHIILRDNERDVRIKALASRVREATGGEK